MYSDLLESPSKDCFPFNDQPSPYDMAEMNEIGSQANLDYLFDSYYSTVSRYNTGFELPEDCKNMSFSELFDQELFSTHENKDCKLTIKIEKENPLESCYSAESSQDITDSHSLVKRKEDVPSSSLSTLTPKSFAPKRGINRTFIKSTKNCSVENLMFNSFCETKNLNIDQTILEEPFVNHEPGNVVNDTIEQNVSMDVKSYYSTDDSQNTFESDGFVKFDDVFSSLTKSCTQKRQGINKTSTTTSVNFGVEQNMFDSVGKTNDVQTQPIVETIKHKTGDLVNDAIEQNIRMEIKSYCFTDDLQHTFERDGFVKFDDNVFSSLTKNSTQKRQGASKTSTKTSLNFDCIDQTPSRIETVKHRPKHLVNDTIKQNIDVKQCEYIDNSQNTYVNDGLVKFDDNSFSSLPKNSTQKHQGIIKNVTKTSVNFNVKQSLSNSVGKTNYQSIDQTSQRVDKVQIETVKHKPGDLVNNTIKQKSCMEVKPLNSIDVSQKTFESLIKVENIKLSSLNKNCTSKRRRTKKTSVNVDVDQSIFNKMQNKSKTHDLITFPTSGKVKLPTVKHEPENVVIDIIKQNVGIEIKSYNSTDDSQNRFGSDNFIKVKDNNLSLLTKNCTSKHQGINKISIKSGNCNVDQPMNNPFFKTEVPKIDPTKMKTNIFKKVSNGVTNDVKRKVVDMDLEVEEKTNWIGLNDFCLDDTNTKNPETEEVFILKKKCLLPNVTSLKNDRVDFPTCKNIDEVGSDTEKKKISWEEFKAKRGDIILLKNSESNEDPVIALDEVDNDKIEAMLKEFDRNTAEHIIGQKRKIEDEEEMNETTESTIVKEDRELQDKRKKIEKVTNQNPYSFASEIAMTNGLIKDSLVDSIENENASDDSVLSSDKNIDMCTDLQDNIEQLKKDDKVQKKGYQTRIHSSRRGSRFDYCNQNSRSSSVSSNPDDYYNRNRIDVPQGGNLSLSSNTDDYFNRNRNDASQVGGKYGQNMRNNVPRPKDQKKVVYVGQIPIKFGRPYLMDRFKEFGKVTNLTLHKKPDFRVYYAFVTYSEISEAEYAISHGNNNNPVQLDIRFGERKQTQTPYYDLDDEWLTDWYNHGYNNQPLAVVKAPQSPKKVTFEEELQEFTKLAQVKKLNQIKPSQAS